MENEETQKQIAQLQMLEQNMQSFLMQKQSIQAQQVEVENALDELGKSSGEVYRIVGPLMMAAKKDVLKSDLESKKEVLALKLKNVDKQETQLREKAQKIQAEVLEQIKKEGGKDA
ncbi:MAG: prefoldin subunit beta [Candidatus Nanoarchaeia archaeon]